MHDIGMKNIRADVKRIMLFEPLAPVEVRILMENLAGQEHPDSLAADIACANQAGLDIQQIPQRKIAFDQCEHPVFTAHHDTAQFIDRMLLLGLHRRVIEHFLGLQK